MRVPFLADDVMLLLLDDETGRPAVDKVALDNVMAGALLLELANNGRVSPATPQDNVRANRLIVRDGSPTGDALLDGALRQLETKPVKGKRAVQLLAKGTREAVLDGLVRRGVIRREQSKILGFIPRNSWLANDTQHEGWVRHRLNAALVGAEKPNEHIGGLIALLYAVDALHKVMDGSRRALKARAKEIVNGDGEFASDAVRQAVQEVRSAVTAAVVVSANGGGDGGGGG